MRVLQIIPALGAGGAEQAVVDINAALIQHGDASFVVSQGGVREAEIVAAGGTHIRLSAASKNPRTIIANSQKLAALIREQKIDIIHARSRAPAWSAWLAARQTGCVYMTTFHAAYAFNNPLKKFYNRVMTRGEHIIAISDFIAQHIKTHYGVAADKITTIYRGINLERFDRQDVTLERITALRSLWKLADGQRVVLLPARLSRIKGHTVLIEAMRLLAEQGEAEDAVVVMIGAEQGRTQYVKDLWNQIISNRLRDRVVLADHCDDMPAAYALADLVVVPSLVPEGFGRVPVEAQVMGVPVIASDLGATRETIIPDVTGWLVPPDDAPALAEKMHLALKLLPAERARLAQQAVAHARSHFTLTKMVQETLAVYQRVLTDKRQREQPDV
jgi:glycosyltransferase involved in cell wall biosynthesis